MDIVQHGNEFSDRTRACGPVTFSSSSPVINSRGSSTAVSHSDIPIDTACEVRRAKKVLIAPVIPEVNCL